MDGSRRAVMVLIAGTSLMGGAVASAKPPSPPKPGFWLTGLPPQTSQGGVTCLTKNGAIAGGYAYGSNPFIGPGFKWSQDGGRDDFGLLPGMPKFSGVSSMSETNALAGVMSDGVNLNSARAYRWMGSGPLQDLGVLPGFTRSYASGISGDGNVVVGHVAEGNMDPATQAFRWTLTKGMEGLGYLKPSSTDSVANAVSRNGTTIVGVSSLESLNEAFVWRENQGMTGLPSLLTPVGASTAEAVNADGTVIVGYSTSPQGISHAVRWVNGEIEDLTIGSIYGGSIAFAVSDDGNVIGGFAGPAFLWTPSTGMLAAEDFLALRGVSVPSNYLLEDINAISGDGLTIAGQAKNLISGVHEGFVATMPASRCKADCDASSELDIDDFICFQTRFAISDPYADCDGDIELTIDDFLCFQSLFAVGC